MRIDRLAAVILGCASLAASASAQSAPPDSQMLSYAVDTGAVVNDGGSRDAIASFVVRVEGADWMRLHFSDVLLGGERATTNASILRITSYLDGATQELDRQHAREWNQSSAYFNGDSVLVEVVASPGTGVHRVALERVEAALGGVQKSQCGPIDNRVLSSDPRSARALPGGCTAWMIDDCNHCFLTAGHCMSSTSVVQFNVPLSTSGGSLVHPPPQHQYSVDLASRQSTNGGVGNDWAYFGVFDNSITSLSPYEAQAGGSYVLATPPPFNPSVTIRITGYGVDSTPPQNNQVQQTSTGPYAAHFGTTLQYQCDTEGGNSGSAVQWEQSGVAVGIHTHGGCSTGGGGANQGTSVAHPGLQAALGNPLGVCRVIPTSTIYCTAKVTSNGCTPSLSTSGLPTIDGGIGSYVITASNVINNKTGLMFYGFSAQALPFLGGTLCVGGVITRTQVQGSGGSVGGTDCTGTFVFDMGGWIAAGVDPALDCGVRAFGQFWFRDSGFSVPDNVGFTNAVDFLIGN